MRKTILVVLTLALVALAACQAPQPTADPTAEQAQPAPTKEPTKAPTPTQKPAQEPTPTPEVSGRLSIAGSTSVQPLAEALAEAFQARYPKVEVDVQGGGSSVGVKSAGQGTVDIGTASRDIKDSEKQEFPDLVVTTIARDGIAVIVHPDVKVDNLTKEQVRDIFAGVITNWKEVGGADRPIVVVSREEGSGTRGAFQEMVMGGEEPPIVETAILQPSSGALRTTVASTPDSIGYISFGYLDNSVKAIAIGGVKPTVENALNGTYPVVRPFNFVTRGEPTGLVKFFINFVLSSDGQQIVADEGYIAVK